MTGQQVALLTDQLLIDQSKLQVYGTQGKLVDGRLVIDRIENSLLVYIRRKDLRTSPLEEYINLLE
ncbi:DUF6624 domain-containing protein [Vibrio sonorensis]|uniref:DUF6624 domain-containing protein n=1 Tax=Vibrio sonorensis TaxID=1004316 RepID=UPI0008D8F710|nr:DUF6624 domain-containing protein [Vibrio sonorensis]